VTKEVNISELQKINSNIELLQFAYSPQIHHPPVENDEDRRQWATDIVFVGNCYPERLRQLEYLVKSMSFAFTLSIYGPNWSRVRRRSSVRPFVRNRLLGPEDMSKAIFYAGVTLGFLCKENRDDHTQRTFEIPACGGVLLAERTARHQIIYREGLEAEFFEASDYEELRLKTERLLRSPHYREELRHRGYEAVVASRNTYKDRMDQVLEAFRRQRSGQRTAGYSR